MKRTISTCLIIDLKPNTMKKLFVLQLLFIIPLCLFAQDYSQLSEIKLNIADDYKNNEAKVMDCANFILSQPYEINEMNKVYCLQFIMRWMEGTPDYTFSIGADFVDLCKEDVKLGSLYMVSLSKAALSNKEQDKTPEDFNSAAKNIFLDYCANPDNNVKKNKGIKKALKQREI